MPDPFTHKKLTDVRDSAPDFGFGDQGEMRFAKDALETEQTAFTYHRSNPNTHSPLGHRHNEAEEVYLVLSGSGRMKLDDEIIEIERYDAIRVAPEVWRGFSSGPDGLEMLAFGARHDGDGEIDAQWWVE